jgi:hypothetical protein
VADLWGCLEQDLACSCLVLMLILGLVEFDTERGDMALAMVRVKCFV